MYILQPYPRPYRVSIVDKSGVITTDDLEKYIQERPDCLGIREDDSFRQNKTKKGYPRFHGRVLDVKSAPCFLEFTDFLRNKKGLSVRFKKLR